MYYIYNLIQRIYKKFLIIRPPILSILLLMPLLYLLGWLLANPFLLLGLAKEKISLIGTIFTFFLFIFSMPKWFEVRWGLKDTWILLGFKKVNKQSEIFLYFLKGLMYAIILLLLIVIPIIINGWGNWLGKLSPDILLNSILLIIGIGLAEELIFRGWLFEELKNKYGLIKGCIYQSLIFSIAHLGFDMPFLQMISILLGLFLLGILLLLIRIKDNNCLWGSAGLHGGLVGIWFLSNNGLIEISKDAPIWLVGPGSVNTNPLGGLYGIFLLIIALIYIFFKNKNKIAKLNKI